MYGPGTLLAGRYRLDERIGGGGMGDVWRATDQTLHRTVAVKVMRSDLLQEAGFAERFLAEARAMAAIKHPGVVAVHDYQTESGRAFLVMEHVAGESLARRLHRFGKLDPARTMALIGQAGDALQAAHDRGVVHRDIKPANLLVTPDDRLVLTDFGIARSASANQLTAAGAVVGTPSYLAPEQVLGKPATPLSDVYALGVVAYECLAGQRPFDGDNPFEVAMKRLREPPPTLPGAVPMPVLAVVERAMAQEPERRWPSASALAAAAREAATARPAEPATAAAPARPLPTKTDSEPVFMAGRVSVPERRARTSLTENGGQPVAAPTSPATRAKPTPPPRRLTPPPRPPRPTAPPTVLVSGLLLRIAAGGLAIYCIALLGVMDITVTVAREQSRNPDSDAAWIGLLAWSAVLSLGGLALAFLLLAWQNSRGSRAARSWTIALVWVSLCCCAPVGVLNGVGVASLDNQTSAVGQALRDAMPPWYGPVTSVSGIIALGALVVAMVLLMMPPANRFFQHPIRPYYPNPYYPAQYWRR
jgi:serine/threonine protein kinase